MTKRTIAIAADHGGVEFKQSIIDTFSGDDLVFLDLGTHADAPADYPDKAGELVKEIVEGRASLGILICGSGVGMSMAANRNPNIRAALVTDATMARLCREHNDANVLCLGQRIIGLQVMQDCVRSFLNTAFEGGRHERRVAKLGCC